MFLDYKRQKVELYQKRLKKARFFAWLVRCAPFVRKICLTGSMATSQAARASDIDFFIQVRPGRIWTARFLSTLLVFLTGHKRSANKVAGRVCLNWYATFDGPQKTGRRHTILAGQSNVFGRLAEVVLADRLGNKVEQALKHYQIKRFQKDSRTHLAGSEVRWSDEELGFHPPKDKK